jgi:flagellar protein FliO/FliZ
VGNSVLVVGVGETIQLLKEIEDEKEREAILSQFENDGSIVCGFFSPSLRGFTSLVHSTFEDIDSSYKEQLNELKQSRSEGKKKGPYHHE